LIELLVVIAIIGALSGVVLQSLNSARVKSRDTQRLASIDQINKALELAATGGTNSLPGGGNNYFCVGLTADTSPTCSVSATKYSATLNTIITTNLAGTIPRDPRFINGIGTAYLYNSNVDPDGAGTVLTTGAYLSWVKEATGTNCGRGSAYTVAVTNGTQCFLRIGNAI